MARTDILAAALGVFSEHGFAGSRIRHVAEAAGIAEGGIYRYFPGKRALFEAVLEEYSFVPQLRDLMVSREQAPAEDSLVEVVDNLLEFLGQRRQIVRVVFGESQRDPEVGQLLRKLAAGGTQLVADYLANSIEHDNTIGADPQMIAKALLFTTVMEFLVRDAEGSSVSEEGRREFAEGLVSALLTPSPEWAEHHIVRRSP